MLEVVAWRIDCSCMNIQREGRFTVCSPQSGRHLVCPALFVCNFPGIHLAELIVLRGNEQHSAS